MGKNKYWVLIITAVLSAAIGAFIGFYINGSKNPFSSRLFFNKDNKIETILEIINQEYVDEISVPELIEKAIPHFINELDPHSSYISGKELSEYNETFDGAYGGVGIEYFIHKDTIVILRVISDSPSHQAGLVAGDRIVNINDTPCVGPDIDIDSVVKKLRGVSGSSVNVGIVHRNTDSVKTFTLVRNTIPVESVVAAYPVEEGIGLIKLYDRFTTKTYDEFINALANLRNIGCHSYIIDLRGNGGGSLDPAINIINEFLPMGRMIVYMQGQAFPLEEIYANGTGNFQDNPVVILMDELSASASEIVAGAIQDNDRGLIIGRRSFGKGLVQNHTELPDASALSITVARYYTPSGRNIQRPYEMGKNDEYNQKWIDQLMSGESLDQDSIVVDSTLIYSTFRGRTVYGGGGIIPDIFVPTDTSHITSYYLDLESKQVFMNFANQYSEDKREQLSAFSDYNEMLNYLKKEYLLWDIVRFADQQGIKRRSNLIYKSSEQILTTTYSFILRNFFGDSAFYPVIMSNDPVIETAIKAIQNGEALSHNIR